jgi:hypothetical protein
MNMIIFDLEATTLARILIVGAVAVILPAFITTLARRWHSYWWVSIAFIIGSWAGLALGSYFAVRLFEGTLASMSKIGGGIEAVFLGVWQATQPALAAAWLAVVMAFVASVFVLPHARREVRSIGVARRTRTATFVSAAAFAIALGIAPALLFRRAIAFVEWAITPGHVVVGSVSRAIETRLLATAMVSASCFLLLIALLVVTVLLARKSTPSPRFFVITVFALVASLGFSVAQVANLSSFANRYHTAARTGRLPAE